MFKLSKSQTNIKSQAPAQSSSLLWQELSETDQEIIKGGPGSLGGPGGGGGGSGSTQNGNNSTIVD